MPTKTKTTTAATIYVRVPQRIKEGAAAYAETNAMTLTAAIADLLDRGLEAVENEESVERLQVQLREKDAALAETAAQLKHVQALAPRADQRLGTCPTCGDAVTALDVLARGQCSKGHPLSAMLSPPAAGPAGLDQTQFLILIGAVGLLLGAAALAKT
jgi:hypothetical protein